MSKCRIILLLGENMRFLLLISALVASSCALSEQYTSYVGADSIITLPLKGPQGTIYKNHVPGFHVKAGTKFICNFGAEVGAHLVNRSEGPNVQIKSSGFHITGLKYPQLITFLYWVVLVCTSKALLSIR